MGQYDDNSTRHWRLCLRFCRIWLVNEDLSIREDAWLKTLRTGAKKPFDFPQNLGPELPHSRALAIKIAPKTQAT